MRDLLVVQSLTWAWRVAIILSLLMLCVAVRDLLVRHQPQRFALYFVCCVALGLSAIGVSGGRADSWAPWCALAVAILALVLAIHSMKQISPHMDSVHALDAVSRTVTRLVIAALSAVVWAEGMLHYAGSPSGLDWWKYVCTILWTASFALLIVALLVGYFYYSIRRELRNERDNRNDWHDGRQNGGGAV